jgi:2-polyprenyl-6-methoxyphenol hydroxylase-like FAD-dependent oxidoreductase
MDDSAAGRVLIAGGGIAGLAMRRALPGNAVQALRQLGLSEALRNIGSPVRRREYRTESGRLLFGIDEAAFWGEEACPRCVRRADLLRLLTLDLPPTDLRPGSEISAVRQMPRGVAVELQDGTAETGGFLVGADGVHSRVRSDTFGASALGAAMLAPASWRFMAPNPGLDAWTLWAGSNGLFLLIPVDHGEVYGWVSVGETAGRGQDLAAFRTAFASFPPLVRDTLDAVLAQPEALYHSPLKEVRIPSWTRNRVALVGDAAHAIAPVWAQGAALALEDALVLAALLAERTEWAWSVPSTRRYAGPAWPMSKR